MDAWKTLLENMQKIQNKSSIKSEFFDKNTGNYLRMAEIPKFMMDFNDFTGEKS